MVSTDGFGHSVYVTAPGDNGLLSFERRFFTRVITQYPGAGCFNSSVNNIEQCGKGVGLRWASAVALSPLSQNVYVASRGGQNGSQAAVTAFMRCTYDEACEVPEASLTNRSTFR